MPLDMAISKNYEAISYTWDNPTKSHSITLEGHEFKVTKSAYDVLCDHSSSWKHQFLWIDSICINQKDNLEKSKQVLLMKMIYQKAFRVVAYLGNDPDSHLAINLLKELRLFREYCPTGEEFYSKYRPEINSERWLALMRLLSHAWFERVWIIQEVVVAPKVAVRYGERYINWKTFVCAIRLLKASDEAMLLVRCIPGEVSRMQSALSKVSHIELLATSQEDFEKGKPTSFQDVIYKYPTFKATDDRDKVYALLGCVSDAAGIPREVLPDYSKSTESLYLDAANALLSSGDPTQLFAHTGIGWHRKFTELPSWVPDWTR
jgi:Heterokaryon incompatibility protein (HET)